MSLVKPYVVTETPAVEEVIGAPASLVCQPAPPPVDTGPITPAPPVTSQPPPATGGKQVIYLYVPDNLTGPVITETRTMAYAPAPPGYTCSTGVYFDIHLGQMGVVPVYETRCYYDYPWLDD